MQLRKSTRKHCRLMTEQLKRLQRNIIREIMYDTGCSADDAFEHQRRYYPEAYQRRRAN